MSALATGSRLVMFVEGEVEDVKGALHHVFDERGTLLGGEKDAYREVGWRCSRR